MSAYRLPDFSLKACVTATAGEVFEDGGIVELIRQQPGSRELSLLWRRGKRSSIGQCLKLPSGKYVPAQLPDSVLRRMFLPARPRSYGTTKNLFDSIAETLQATCNLRLIPRSSHNLRR